MKLIRYEYPLTSGSSYLNRLIDFGAPAIERFERLFNDFLGADPIDSPYTRGYKV